MFNSLSEHLEGAFKNLKGEAKIIGTQYCQHHKRYPPGAVLMRM